MIPDPSQLAPHLGLNSPRYRLATSPFVFFVVEGGDALDWLQGQLTNDIRLLKPTSGLHACLCSPTGQIVAILVAWLIEGRVTIAAQEEGVEALLARFDQMVILEDVRISPVAMQPSIFVSRADDAWGNDSDPFWTWAGARFSTRLGSSCPIEEHGSIADSTPALEHDFLRCLELAAGTPRHGLDTDARTLPAELGSHFLDLHVHFAKGCYTGQEVVMRIHSRGRVNRRWVGLRSLRPFETGSSLFIDGEPVGKVNWSGRCSDYFLGSALVGSSATDHALITVAEGSRFETAEVVPLPFGMMP